MSKSARAYEPMLEWMETVGDPVFLPAHESVVSGASTVEANTSEVLPAGQCLGTPVRVAVCAGDTYRAPPERLLTGRTISVGHSEPFPRGLLRCFRDRDRVCVAYFERGELASMVLRVRTTTDEIDEGLFTWFGPRIYLGTPWSDNDPDQVDYATVEHLRQFAEGRARRQKRSA